MIVVVFIAATLLRVNYKTGQNLHICTHARHSLLHNCKYSGGWHPAIPAGLWCSNTFFKIYIFTHATFHYI
jgi:hypothetical protein